MALCLSPPFSMASKLLILHGEAKSNRFPVSRVPKSTFNYLKKFHARLLTNTWLWLTTVH